MSNDRNLLSRSWSPCLRFMLIVSAVHCTRGTPLLFLCRLFAISVLAVHVPNVSTVNCTRGTPLLFLCYLFAISVLAVHFFRNPFSSVLYLWGTNASGARFLPLWNCLCTRSSFVVLAVHCTRCTLMFPCHILLVATKVCPTSPYPFVYSVSLLFVANVLAVHCTRGTLFLRILLSGFHGD